MIHDILNCYRTVNPHVSVDCVLIAFDGTQLNVLLVKQTGQEPDDMYNNFKLPGSLIYEDEDIDESAMRVLYELTGLSQVQMHQFKTFGKKDRVSNPRDARWLSRFHKLQSQVGRIVTVAYVSLLRLDRKLTRLTHLYEAAWVPIKDVPTLAFDHNEVLEKALEYIRHNADLEPALMFDLLPKKFTAAQFRMLYELIYDKPQDVRNFHKKLLAMEYVIDTGETEHGVSHRAARYYRFDKVIYNKVKRGRMGN